MLHVSVADATAWHDHVCGVKEDERFRMVRVSGPKEESYGALVTYVWDPAGVLLHFAEWREG